MRDTFSFLAVRGVAFLRLLALIALCLAVLPIAARELGTLRGMCAGLVIGPSWSA